MHVVTEQVCSLVARKMNVLQAYEHHSPRNGDGGWETDVCGSHEPFLPVCTRRGVCVSTMITVFQLYNGTVFYPNHIQCDLTSPLLAIKKLHHSLKRREMTFICHRSRG